MSAKQEVVLVLFVVVLGVGMASADVGYLDSGSIVAWGLDDYGQVGDTPVGIDFAVVTSCGGQSGAMKTDGSLVFWGRDDSGQVSNTPAGTNFVAAVGGNYHNVALKTDGSLVSWGRDGDGQVSNTPAGTGFAAIGGGNCHSLAVKTNGSLVSWGRDNYGQVSNTPTGTNFASVAGGSDHSLAVKTDGSLVSWGRDGDGQVSNTPAGTGFAAVAGGWYHSVALKTDGSVVSWGLDGDGQVSNTPAGTNFAAVAAGGYHNIALKTDGSLVSWGRDDLDQVSNTPAIGYYLGVAAGYRHSIALKARHEYEDLIVTGTGARALLQRNVSVSGNATIDTTMTLENNPTLNVDGELIITENAAFTGSGAVSCDTVRLQGATFDPTNLGVETARVVGNGTFNGAFQGNVVTVNGGDLTVGNPNDYAGFHAGSAVVVGVHTLTVQSKGFASLGISTTLNGGTLVAANGVVVGPGRSILGAGMVDAKVSATFGSTIEATGPLSLGDATAYDGFFSDGSLLTGAHTVTINDRNEAVLGSLTQLGDGSSGGALTAGNAAPADTHAHFLLEQGKNMVGRGSVNGNYKNHGHVIGDGIAPPQRIVFESGWTVSGKGTFEYVGFKGTFAPGDSPTITSTTHAWYADATVQVELGGTTPGSGNENHDQINDTATVWLDHAEPPTLEILPWSNFVPEIGDEFVILTWQESLDGLFGDVIVDPWFITNGLDFDLHYNNVDGQGNLTIEATPEPATLSLLALGGLALVRRRKRGDSK